MLQSRKHVHESAGKREKDTLGTAKRLPNVEAISRSYGAPRDACTLETTHTSSDFYEFFTGVLIALGSAGVRASSQTCSTLLRFSFRNTGA